MTTWEYYAYEVQLYNQRTIIERMDDMGAKGWELVAALPFVGPHDPSNYAWLFWKRPLEPTEVAGDG